MAADGPHAIRRALEKACASRPSPGCRALPSAFFPASDAEPAALISGWSSPPSASMPTLEDIDVVAAAEDLLPSSGRPRALARPLMVLVSNLRSGMVRAPESRRGRHLRPSVAGAAAD
jgi:hypothetical protein